MGPGEIARGSRPVETWSRRAAARAAAIVWLVPCAALAEAGPANAIPEPSALAAFALGLLAVSAAARRVDRR